MPVESGGEKTRRKRRDFTKREAEALAQEEGVEMFGLRNRRSTKKKRCRAAEKQ